MARIFPFQPFRYSPKAGPLAHLVTQPYDKISPSMQARYLALSPYNLVRIILGERKPGDTETDNVYTRAAGYLESWIASGILAADREPSVFAYFQEFTEPDTEERLTRKGFIALGAVEDYSAGVVHRHEWTLAGPKKDRLELLRHTHVQAEQLFLLYPDPEGAIDRLLDEAAQSAPLGEVTDEYGAIHRLWRISPADRIRQSMADKKLIIADGHHRYETALAFRHENPGLAGADRVPMTFVNMYSPGLRILATHRLVNGVDTTQFLERAAADFLVEAIDSPAPLRAAWAETGDKVVIGAAIGNRLYLLEELAALGDLDVGVLHRKLLESNLGIDPAAVRDEKHLQYVRGLDTAIAAAREGAAQIAFLLKPTSLRQVADTSFGGGVMPQKSTDFYPKLLSGLTIYKL
ncbi:MAG: DUF1015 domain-containing protein [Bryobacteraceae bacterium]